MTATADAPAAAPEPVTAPEPSGGRAWLGKAGWYPLAILFGLNMADELDRSAYGLLLPEIRDDLGLSNTGILSVVAVAGAIAPLLPLPLAHPSDRAHPVRCPSRWPLRPRWLPARPQ